MDKRTAKDQIIQRLREAAAGGFGIYVSAEDVENLISLISVAGLIRWLHAKRSGVLTQDPRDHAHET